MNFLTLDDYVKENGKIPAYLLMGAPGSGKGFNGEPVAKELKDELSYAVSGEIMRAEAKKDFYPQYEGVAHEIMRIRKAAAVETEMVECYQAVLRDANASKFSSDQLITKIFNETIVALANLGYVQAKKPVLVDGMSRTIPQIQLFDKYFDVQGQIWLVVERDLSINRQLKRADDFRANGKEVRLDDQNGETGAGERYDRFVKNTIPAIIARPMNRTCYVDGALKSEVVRQQIHHSLHYLGL